MYKYKIIRLLVLILYGAWIQSFMMHAHDDMANKIRYIIGRYEKSFNGQKYLFFPAKNPQRLVISFAWYTPEEKYAMWSWFWNDNEAWENTSYLFLYDSSASWYLGKEEQGEKATLYSSIILDCINKLSINPKNVYTIGISSGGYGALLYAIRLHLGAAILFIPQINQGCTVELFKLQGWASVGTEHIFWQDLNHLIDVSDYVPYVSLNFGDHPGDNCAGMALMSSLLRKNSLFIVRKLLTKQHNVGNLHKKLIEEDIKFLEIQQDFSLSGQQWTIF